MIPPCSSWISDSRRARQNASEAEDLLCHAQEGVGLQVLLLADDEGAWARGV